MSLSGFSFGGGKGAANLNELAAYESEIADTAAVDFPEDEDEAYPVLHESAAPGRTREAKMSTTKDAIVSIGESVGDYKELDGVGPKLKRDPRFPVRVTVQFYKTTSNGGISAEDLAIIASQFDEVRTKTQGSPKPATSLVTEGDTGRPTEPGKAGWPAWWIHYYATSTDLTFFNTLGDDYQSVGARLFKGGRFHSGRDAADVKALERYVRMQQEAKPGAAGAARWRVF
jgi:hypothetical protein